MSGGQLWDRRNWLDHLHACPRCTRRQLCRIGRYLGRAVAEGMSREETLPAWLTPQETR